MTPIVSSPKAPDPAATAAAQSGMNQDTAESQQLLNMTNQQTPDGSLTYGQTGTNSYVNSAGKTVTLPQYTATTTLSPAQQAIKDKSDAASLNLAGIADDQSSFLKNYLGTPVDLSRSGIDGYINQNYDGDFNSQWDKSQDAQRTQLISTGVRPGTAAYDNAMADFSNNRSKAHDNLMNDAYSTAVQTKLAERNQPLNEISALMSGSQVQNPTFANTPSTSVGGVDYSGLVENQYQQQVASSNAAMGGLFGLLSAPFQAMKFSDARLKTDIRWVGMLNNGLPIYSYRFGNGPTEIGLIAQEVERARPDAVAIHPSGYLVVDYERASV